MTHCPATYVAIQQDSVPGLRRIAPAGAPAGADGRAPDAAAPAGAGSFGAILLSVAEFRCFAAEKTKVYVCFRKAIDVQG